MGPVRPSRGPSDILFVEDIRFFGHHGVTPAQQEVGAWFSVNVELTLDLTPAALSDDLDAGVDYGQVVERVVAVGTGEPVRLIERLAGVLCETLLREYPARDVTVTVRKLTAPIDGVAAIPGVRVTRSR
jgi:dihydroneopterin aldolase